MTLLAVGGLACGVIGVGATSAGAAAASEADFIAAIAPPAQRVQATSRIPASVTIAQSALESAWGASRLTVNDSNYFGFKCVSANDPGPIAISCHNYPTTECTPTCHTVNAYFRVYRNAEDSLRDYARLLTTSDRYQPAFQHTNNPDEFIRQIHRGGYATDPQYADKVISIMQDHNLYRYNTGTPPLPPSVFGDWSGDGRADVGVWRPSTGGWHVPDVFGGGAYGGPGDIPVHADWTGDGKADRGVWRPSTGQWFVPGTTFNGTAYGGQGDIPVPADWNGDRKADIGVWRPSTGQWFVPGTTFNGVAYGGGNDIPIVADWTGDGKADRGVWRPSTGQWYVPGVLDGGAYGGQGDIPVPADWNGDRKADIGVWRPSTGQWYVPGVLDGGVYGGNGDIPLATDWTGDGRADTGVWRPTTGSWHVIGVLNGGTYGTTGDIPLATPPNRAIYQRLGLRP